MASQLLKAIVNRPQSFVAEARHCASRAFADEKGERRSTDPYDRPMPVLWSCPDPNCPPTAIAPADVTESGEAAGAEPERFTTDEVAALLNVPLGTIHKERRRPVVGGARGNAGCLSERVRCDLCVERVHYGEGLTIAMPSAIRPLWPEDQRL